MFDWLDTWTYIVENCIEYDDVCFVSPFVPFPSLNDALPFNLFIPPSSFTVTHTALQWTHTLSQCHTVTHPSSFLVCSLPISHRDGRHFSFEGTENNVRLHCVRPVIGVIVWKVQWQLDLKRAITSNPTTPLMASLSSSIVSTSPPTLSSPSFSANQCSWPHHHVCLLPHRRTRTTPVDGKA